MKNSPPIYSIKDWGKNFETAESRRCKNILWVSIPTTQTGRGFLRVSRHPENSRIFAAWVLMVQLAANGAPRGVLATDDGPYTAEDMALKTGFPESDFRLALEVLAQPGIGWIESTPGQSTVTPGDAREHPGNPGRKDEEQAQDSEPRMNPENPGTPGQTRAIPVTPGDARATEHNKTLQDITGQDIVSDASHPHPTAPASPVSEGEGDATDPAVLGWLSAVGISAKATTPTTHAENPGSGEAAAPREAIRPEAEDANAAPAKEIAKLWNEVVAGTSMPQVIALSDARRALCKSAWAFFEGDKAEKMQGIRELFDRVKRSSFLANGTCGTFDWVLKPANRLKVLEGNYDDRAPAAFAPRNGGRR